MPVTRKLMKLRVTSEPISALSASASVSPSTTPFSPALGSLPRSRCMSRKPNASSCQPTTTACVSSLTWSSVPSSPDTPATPGTPAMALPSACGQSAAENLDHAALGDDEVDPARLEAGLALLFHAAREAGQCHEAANGECHA